MSIVKVRAALEARLATVAEIFPSVAIQFVVAGSVAIFTTVSAHGLISGMPVQLPGYSGGTPVLAGVYTVVVLSSTTFSLQNTATKATVSLSVAGSGGVVSANLTSFQNAIYQPVAGVPYQEVHMVPFKPDEPTQGAGYYREHGLFQVTLVYPLGVGTGALLARAELIRSSFRRGSSFVSGGVTVQILETPEFGHLDGTEDSIRMPVKVYYSANIFN
jgi:hypothetical protein